MFKCPGAPYFHNLVKEKDFFSTLKLYPGLLITIYLLLPPNFIIAQQKVLDPVTAHVNWVKQYPSVANNNTERRFGEKFTDFVFGRKNRFELIRPVGVVAIDSGQFFTIDQENGLIFKVNMGVGEITHFRNKQYKVFPSLVGICSMTKNKILFTDSFMNKVFFAVPDKKELRSVNDSISFERPTGVAFSPFTHEIWIAETGAHRITVLDQDGKLLKRIGSRGTEAGQFNFPSAIWIDQAGKVYIVDALNFRIQVYSPEGQLIHSFGKNGDAAGNFARPKGIATDSFGNIYVADALFNVVQIFDSTGQFLYRFGKQGQNTGEFWMPNGIFIDARDYIYVADSYNSRVQVFQLNANGGHE